MTRKRKDVDTGNPARDILGRMAAEFNENARARNQAMQDILDAEYADRAHERQAWAGLIRELQVAEGSAQADRAALLGRITDLEDELRTAGDDWWGEITRAYDADPNDESNPLHVFYHTKVDELVARIESGSLLPTDPLAIAINRVVDASVQPYEVHAAGLEADNVALQRDLNDAGRELGDAQAALSRARLDQGTLRTQYQDACDERDDVQRRLDALQATCQSVMDERDEQQYRADIAEADADSLDSELRAIRVVLDESRDETLEALRAVRGLEEGYAQLEVRLNQIRIDELERQVGVTTTASANPLPTPTPTPERAAPTRTPVPQDMTIPTALPLMDNDARGWYQKRALAAYNRGDHDKAVKLFDKSSEPRSLGMQGALARSLYQSNDANRAFTVYRALMANPSSKPFAVTDVRRMAIANAPDGQHQGSVFTPEFATAVLGQVPASGREEALRWVVDAYEAKGDTSRAVRMASLLVSEFPSEENKDFQRLLVRNYGTD